jgi:hypothetical protein
VITFFVVHDPETGSIIRSGACPQEIVYLQAGEGQAALETDAEYRSGQFRVDLDTGDIVAVETTENG